MSELSTRQHIFLEEIGVGPVWTRRTPKVVVDQKSVHQAWAVLKTTIAECAACGACQRRDKTVFGVGNQQAQWLFVVDHPHDEADPQVGPFSPEVNDLFEKMLAAMNVSRDQQAYVTTLVKGCPMNGSGLARAPMNSERSACMHYFAQQFDWVRPRIMVVMGEAPAQFLLKKNAVSLDSMRGIVHQYSDCSVIVTYHPAHLLQHPEDKKKAWADLRLAMHTYG